MSLDRAVWVSMTSLDGLLHVIWDWNGTLLDDLWLALDVANLMLARRGIAPMDEERYREIFDFPVEEYYRRAGFDFDREPFSVLADEFISGFDPRVGECRLHGAAPAVLDALATRSITQTVLSASRRQALLAAVAGQGLEAYFEAVHGLDDHFAVSKAELGMEVARSLPLARESVLLIGDTTHDAEVAARMGVPCILIARGHQSARRLRTAGVPVYESLDLWWDAVVGA